MDKNFEITPKIPNVTQNIARIVDQQLAILEYSPCFTNCFFVLFEF